MTSQSSSTEIKTPARAGLSRLLANTLRRKWTTGLLITIIMFFLLPMPVMMTMSTLKVTSPTEELVNRTQGIIYEWCGTMRLVMIPLFSILAVVMSCIMLRRLHEKTAVDFYHSLPIRRERLLTNDLAAGYILLLLPFIAMLATAAVIIAANGYMNADVFVSMIRIVTESVSYSLIYYGLASLIGVVTGLTSVQLLLTGVTVFIVPAFYFVSVYFLDIFNENMWTGWYLRSEIVDKLSPVTSFIVHSDRYLSAVEYTVYFFAAALLLAATYLVYRRFRSERAGNPVIFPILGEVIKYVIMTLMTVAVGLLFYQFIYSFFWTVFGMVCGCVLTFMLINTILHKSAKAMFRGMKGLTVYVGIAAALTSMLVFNAFGINTSIPAAISKVEVQLGEMTPAFIFRDRETTEALRSLYTDSEWQGSDYRTYDDREWYRERYEHFYLRSVFHPAFGIPQAKSVTVTNRSELAELLKTVADSREFAEQYSALPSMIDGEWIGYNGIRLSIDKRVIHESESDRAADKRYKAEFIKALAADLEKPDFELFQSAVIAIQPLRLNDRTYIRIPITLNMKNVCKLIYDCGYINVPAEQLSDALAECIESVTVYDCESGNERVYTYKTQLRELLGSSTSFEENFHEVGELTVSAPNYVITYEYRSIADSDDHADTESTGYAVAETVYRNEVTTTFLYGRVPAFVEADLAG